MPIDDNLITTLLAKLNLEMSKQRIATIKIQRVVNTLTGIQTQKRVVQNETTGEIEETILPIIDAGTGKPITDDRKQTVYDSSIAEANEILAIVPPSPGP